MGFGLGVLALLAAGVVWVFKHWADASRDAALEKAARSLSMDWRFGLPPGLREHLNRFRAIEKARESGGDFAAGINTITGLRRGRKLAFFDYQWTTVRYGGRRRRWGFETERAEYRTTHTRSAVAAELGVALQPVLVRPERLLDKALALIGYDDIDIAALPDFSEKFYVAGPDREAARRLVTPAFARFCRAELRGSVDFCGPWLLLHQDDACAAGDVARRLELASRLADLVTREGGPSR